MDVPRLHMVETASRYVGQLRMWVHRTNSRWQPTITVNERNVAYTLVVFGFHNRIALRTAKQESSSIQQTLGPRLSDVDKSNLAFCAALSISMCSQYLTPNLHVIILTVREILQTIYKHVAGFTHSISELNKSTRLVVSIVKNKSWRMEKYFN